MEKDNKYYTPSIEEFHVGFEFEHFNKDARVIMWEKVTLPFYNNYAALWSSNPDLKYFRVKYLDKEDIEECGFKPDHVGTLHHEKGYNMSIYSNIKIAIWTDNVESRTLFNGIIKNKSELKVLLKWLKITD